MQCSRVSDKALMRIWSSIQGDPKHLQSFTEIESSDSFCSCFPVSDLATASIGAAGLALAEWMHLNDHQVDKVSVDRRLASLWCSHHPYFQLAGHCRRLGTQ